MFFPANLKVCECKEKVKQEMRIIVIRLIQNKINSIGTRARARIAESEFEGTRFHREEGSPCLPVSLWNYAAPLPIYPPSGGGGRASFRSGSVAAVLEREQRKSSSRDVLQDGRSEFSELAEG